MARAVPPIPTPDGRYLVIAGRLWRASNPNLPASQREALVHALMTARRAVKEAKRAGDDGALRAARAAVDAAKHGLGERGSPWWSDAPDYNRKLVRNTPYDAWWQARSGPSGGGEPGGLREPVKSL